MILAIWLALIDAIYSWIAPFFVLKCIFFLAHEKGLALKTVLKHKFSTVYRRRDSQFIKILCFSDWILWFQVWCNKMVILLSGVQFWSEISIVISNYVYDFRLNCTPFSSIFILLLFKNLISCNSVLYIILKYLIRRSQICSSSLS